MNKTEVKKRIQKLRKVINYHRYLYHVLDKQEISENALDSLKHELYNLEKQFPEFISPDSPTQRVAGLPLKGFKKVNHKVPMLSIEDVFSEKELKDWEDYLKRLIPFKDFTYFSELKIDGFAVSLIYKKGLFEQGATRGNSRQGEDVTQNLKTIESIPLKLKIHSSWNFLSDEIQKNIKKQISKGIVEVRGEVYMEKNDFERINKEMTKKGEKAFANPRNLAAGSIRQLDPKLAAERPLKFFAYDIITDFGQKKHSKTHQILSILGFKTDKGKECRDLKEVIDYWKKTAKKRESFSFQIDGVVVSVDDSSVFEKLGVVGKSPRGVRAFKFSPREATTVIEDIKLQVGRTGALTPVAVLKPVDIDGAMITRATLHNADEIERLDVRIGDTVSVVRAGDVIPAVTKAFSELRTGREKKFKMPNLCPSCQTGLIKPKGEAIWRCPNPDCFARKRKYFYHFISKGAFDIEGLGPKIIDKLLDQGLISDPADLFKLKEGDVLPLEGFAEKAAENLIKAIRSKRKITLSRFIYALGIRNVGEETASLLAERFGNLEGLKKVSFSELEKIRDIGPIVADSIYNFFQERRNLKFIEKLKKVGAEIKESSKFKVQSSKLRGLIFVLTGSLETMAREDAKEKIRFLGGRVSGSVSGNTDYLVVGKEPGSKFEKAKKLGIKIIGEEEFLKFLK
jgi:DNA ligase (NAD+)